MGCPRRKALSVLLILVPVYLHGASSQRASPAGQRKPCFERLRRLEERISVPTTWGSCVSNSTADIEPYMCCSGDTNRECGVLSISDSTVPYSWQPAEKFRRFQEVTSTHLQDLASSYNLSYGIDAWLQNLARETQAVALAMNHSQATVQGDLSHLKTWMQKTRRRSWKVESRVLALGAALSERDKQCSQEGKGQQEHRAALSGLVLDLRALQDTLAHLMHLVQGQGARLAALEGRLQGASPGTVAPGLTPARPLTPPGLPSPSSPMLQRGRQALRAPPETGDAPQDPTGRLQGTQAPPGPGGQWAWPPERAGETCDVGPVLVFPNASTQNVAFLSSGFPWGLRALSVCSWVRTASGRLGTLLSYATEENDNRLVLRGRDSLAPGSIYLVIGDPAFRELPLQPLLDGRWHHVRVIWMFTLGRYWLHMDRGLVATSSRFREGYEIPVGGSLVLGQEQDSMGGGFDSSEAFVGSMAGLAIRDRALVPGEVAKLATGRKVPGGAILTLDDAQWGGGFMQRVNCSCLELCP